MNETKIAEEKKCKQCKIKFIPVKTHPQQKFCNVRCKNTFHGNKLIETKPNHKKDYFDKYWDNYYNKNKDKISKKNKEYRKKNPKETKARQQLNNSIIYGRIKVEMVKCESCNRKDNLIKHHPDYSKPFEFIVLCRSCHNKVHKKITDLRNAIKLYDKNGI